MVLHLNENGIKVTTNIMTLNSRLSSTLQIITELAQAMNQYLELRDSNITKSISSLGVKRRAQLELELPLAWGGLRISFKPQSKLGYRVTS